MSAPSFDPVHHEAHPDEVPSLPDLLEMVRHVVDDLDLISEHLTAHRDGADDGPEVLHLHAVEDNVSRAWAHARLALTDLGEHLAVKP